VIHNKKLLKLSLWLTFSAILSATLAPTISRLVYEKDIPMPGIAPTSQVAEKQEVQFDCHSVSGSDAGGGSPSGHCLFCFIPGCPFELKSFAIVSPLLRMASLSLPLYALFVPYLQPIWEPNRARAPPVFLQGRP
jgi:hypothetical protein